MTKEDKRIYDTLMNISKGCTYMSLIYGTCAGCPFLKDRDCTIVELGNALATEPENWDMTRIKELIEL